MKTSEEIKEKLEIYEKIREKASWMTSEFALASGAITALEWVLEKGE